MFVNSFPPNFAEQKRIRPLFLPEGMPPVRFHPVKATILFADDIRYQDCLPIAPFLISFVKTIA
jgi:hypothetical protein